MIVRVEATRAGLHSGCGYYAGKYTQLGIIGAVESEPVSSTIESRSRR
jgi:hypothetical protein